MKSLKLRGEKNRASGISCPLFIKTKMKKAKVWKECQTNFIFFQTEILHKVLFQTQNIFSAYPGDFYMFLN